MKEGIHPGYQTTSVVCSCGNRFETRSTSGGDLHVELCNQCHPFFTGQQKFVDTGGRVQRFSDKFGAAATAVLEKDAAEKESRRKAAEEAAAKAKQERDAKAAEKAAKAAKYETKAAKSEAAAASKATEGETVPETTEVPGAEDKDAVEVGPAGDDTAAEETAE